MSANQIIISALTFAVIGLGACQGPKKNTGKPDLKKPNIVYILADDLGYGDLGSYGQATLKTPNLDRMAREGMLFTQHYAGSSVCAPSRASLMTGRDTGHSRVRGNYETGPHGFGGELELRPQDITIAEIMKRAEYQTALIGKWGLGMNGTTGEPNKKGFDYSYGFLNQAHAHDQFPDYLYKNGRKVTVPENIDYRRGYFSNDIFTDDAIRFLDQKGNAPFFLYLAFVTPHAEMIVPHDSIFNSYKGKFEETPYIGTMEGSNGTDSLGAYRSQPFPQAAFATMITHIDNDVQRILNKLKELGIDNNTLVVFSSDNGPHQEGGNNPYYFNSNGSQRGIKRDLYEGGIREPMIARWPEVIQGGQVIDHISSFCDILPTFSELAKVDITDVPNEGISLVPTLLGNPDEQKQHAFLYWEFHENKYSDQAVRMGRWKAVRHDPDGISELYDLQKDPKEQVDLSKHKPGIIQRMDSIMDHYRTDNEYFPIKRSGMN